MTNPGTVSVGYSLAELSEAISADMIPQAQARAVLQHAGKLWVVTGSMTGRDMPQQFYAVAVEPEGIYSGERTTYHERSAELLRMDFSDAPGDRDKANAERRHFYAGLPVHCRGVAYRFTRLRAVWESAARLVDQVELF